MCLTLVGLWTGLVLLKYGRSMTLSLLYVRCWRLIIFCVFGQVNEQLTGLTWPIDWSTDLT